MPYPWNEGDELTYTDLNASFALAFQTSNAALTAAQLALMNSQAALSQAMTAQANTLASLTALIMTLPRSPPANSAPNLLYLDGDLVCLSH